MRQLPELDESCFVRDGRFRQGRLHQRHQAADAKHLYIGAMVGKLTKMCQGLGRHPRLEGRGRSRHPGRLGAEVGAPDDLIEETAPPKPPASPPNGWRRSGCPKPFHRQLARKAIRSLTHPLPGAYRLAVLVYDFEAQFICRVEDENPV